MNSARSYMSFGPLAALIWAVVFAMPGELPASEECPNWLARVVSVQGSLQIRREGENRWIDGKRDDALCPGDMVRVLENSRAAIVLRSEAVVRLDRNTSITLAESQTEGTVDFHFLSGLALFLSRFPFGLRIFTPFVNADIEGTELLVRVGKTETSLIVYEGKIRAGNEAGALVLGKGDAASAGAGSPPVLKTVARPRDAVQWALYYPPIPESELEALTTSTGPWTEALSASLESYRKGDLAGAFAHVEKVHPELNDPVFHAYLALLYLTVGRVEEASSRLERAVSLDPRNSYAVSLQSIVALTKNRKEEALDLARRAATMSPSSAAPLVALSYVQQARFDLDEALATMKEAVDLAPGDGLVRARLAELWLSKGRLDEALDAARRAVAQDPGLARAHGVLGYAYLSQIRTAESRKAFEKAMQLDQADPLPRLGLGLALIRDGELKAGRKEIEIAAVLDPNNSLIRSYLGKAYYEEKDDRKAAAELSTAKELDPLDPTPWLYDAIRKQTVNRPVEALEDLQRSIALNDNRAVYRSRLLLDEDLAARSISLARVYDDLGFQWLALVEGAKSLELDPANFSAHRFLADSFFSLPRHDVARVSELLQSQLLQPINILPIQPQLAEGSLFPFQGVGPRDPSFNEYTPLFARDRLALLLGGLAGERDTLADDVVQSGVLGRFSYSLGQFHFETDGFRVNDDQTQNIYNAFAQVSLTPKTSIQAEYRHKDQEFGDLLLLFDPNTVDPRERQEQERETVRFGFHHGFAPGSDLIGSFMWQKIENEFSSLDLDSMYHGTGFGAEAQHMHRSEIYNLIIGAGHFKRSEEVVSIFFGDTLSNEFDTKHTNLYLYYHLNYPESIVWTLGVSADFFKGGSPKLDTRQVNPKFGITWSLFPGTTLRAAVFRAFKRTLLTDQTVEPTQVAGFNQFFDDGEGTEAWRYGVGLDRKFTDSLFAGAEISKRDLSAPVIGFFTEETTTEEGDEVLGRAYLYWIPHRWLALGPEYQYDLTEFGPELPAFGIARLETHRLALGTGLFHPSGFLARLRPAIVFQDSEHRLVPYEPVASGHSDFFVLDASIGYRLPKRLGLIEIVAKNLFDEGFRFQDTDPANPQITPRRLIAARWVLSF